MTLFVSSKRFVCILCTHNIHSYVGPTPYPPVTTHPSYSKSCRTHANSIFLDNTIYWHACTFHFHYAPPQVRVVLWNLASTMAHVIITTTSATITAAVPQDTLAPDARTLMTTTITVSQYMCTCNTKNVYILQEDLSVPTIICGVRVMEGVAVFITADVSLVSDDDYSDDSSNSGAVVAICVVVVLFVVGTPTCIIPGCIGVC